MKIIDIPSVLHVSAEPEQEERERTRQAIHLTSVRACKEFGQDCTNCCFTHLAIPVYCLVSHVFCASVL
jgi:hypothetical protein